MTFAGSHIDAHAAKALGVDLFSKWTGNAGLKMHFGKFKFGSIAIDDATYVHDVLIDRGEVLKRKKKPSKRFRDQFGHTPVSVEEKLPWKCKRLVIGTGKYGSLPVMDDVRREAKRRRIDLLILPTDEAIQILRQNNKHANAILHLTC